MLDKLLNYGRALPYMRKDWWNLYNASKSSGGGEHVSLITGRIENAEQI